MVIIKTSVHGVYEIAKISWAISMSHNMEFLSYREKYGAVTPQYIVPE